MTQRVDLLDMLFTNANQFMDELIAQNAEFTNGQMFRELMADQQRAYIELLYLEREKDNPFNTAHMLIDKRLVDVARDAGYEHDGETLYDEYDIFDNLYAAPVYRPV